jgi:hypothetical protein
MCCREDREPLKTPFCCLSRLEGDWRLHDRQAVAATSADDCVRAVTPALLIPDLLINRASEKVDVMQCLVREKRLPTAVRPVYIEGRSLYTKNRIQYIRSGDEALFRLLRFVLGERVTKVQLPGHRIVRGNSVLDHHPIIVPDGVDVNLARRVTTHAQSLV